MVLLENLSGYYDQLLESHPDDVAQPGWSTCYVKGFLEIDRNGRLRSICLLYTSDAADEL